MKFKEYQQQTKRTLPKLHLKYFTSTVDDSIMPTSMPLHLLDIVHMRTGMASELSELLNGLRSNDLVNIGEELGDMLWYIANDLTICKKIAFIDEETYNKFAKIEFGQPMVTDGGYQVEGIPELNWFPAVVFSTSELVDQVKKWLAYGKAPKKEAYITLITYLLGAINNLAISKEIKLEDYMEKNINKLRTRYPDKFEENLAVNRNLDEERKALES